MKGRVKVANRKTTHTLNARRSTDPVRISERRTLHVGQTVRIRGERGEFVFKWAEPDGSLTFYGGDRNPLGHQAYRSFMPDRVRSIKRGQQ